MAGSARRSALFGRASKQLLVPVVSLLAVLMGALATVTDAGATVPPFASAYTGTVFNETYGIETTLELTEVREGAGGELSGRLVVGPGLSGTGPFEGTVSSTGSLLLVVPHPAGFSRTELSGEVAPTGVMGGHYVIEPGPQVGRWEVAPKTVPLAPPAPPPAPAPIATSPPTVTITAHPPRETAEATAGFSFAGVAGGTYECSLDAGAWTACATGASFGPLQPGDHRFEVRETLNGTTGPAASWSWTVDLPKACVLKVARARVFAFTHQDRVRLVIHYKAYKPAQVTVSYSLAGGKRGLGLGSASARFKTAGIFRTGETLGKDAARVQAASSMTVKFRVPQAPSNCTRYYTKRLTIPKKVFGQTVWFQSDSIFGPEAGGRQVG